MPWTKSALNCDEAVADLLEAKSVERSPSIAYEAGVTGLYEVMALVRAIKGNSDLYTLTLERHIGKAFCSGTLISIRT